MSRTQSQALLLPPVARAWSTARAPPLCKHQQQAPTSAPLAQQRKALLRLVHRAVVLQLAQPAGEAVGHQGQLCRGQQRGRACGSEERPGCRVRAQSWVGEGCGIRGTPPRPPDRTQKAVKQASKEASEQASEAARLSPPMGSARARAPSSSPHPALDCQHAVLMTCAGVRSEGKAAQFRTCSSTSSCTSGSGSHQALTQQATPSTRALACARGPSASAPPSPPSPPWQSSATMSSASTSAASLLWSCIGRCE